MIDQYSIIAYYLSYQILRFIAGRPPATVSIPTTPNLPFFLINLICVNKFCVPHVSGNRSIIASIIIKRGSVRYEARPIHASPTPNEITRSSSAPASADPGQTLHSHQTNLLNAHFPCRSPADHNTYGNHRDSAVPAACDPPQSAHNIY